MRARTYKIAIAATSLVAAFPAKAVVGDYTYRGTVGSIVDASGIFGTAAAGDPFTLVFRVDTDRGSFGVGGGGFGEGGQTHGGTRYIGSPDVGFAPRIVLSPVSAVLTIDGHSLVFAGAYDGSQSTSNAAYFDQHDVLQYSSGSDEAAQDELTQGGVTTADYIEAAFTASRALHLPLVSGTYSVTFDGDFQSTTTFTYSRYDANIGQGVATSGVLNSTDFAVAPEAAVPEPGSWALLLAGFALTGGALRSRREVCA